MPSVPRWFACVALAALGAGCGFPDVIFTGENDAANAGGGDASGATSTGTAIASSAVGPGGGTASASAGGGAAASGSGGDAAASGSGGGGAGGDAAASGSGGAGTGGGGAGGDAAASGSGGAGTGGGGAGGGGAGGDAAASGSGGGGTVDCDADKDGYRSIHCDGGTDCNDSDPRVHPNQPGKFYEEPISPEGGFDYDCSGKEEKELPSTNCSGLVCAAMTNVFLTDVPCGHTGPLGDCNTLCQFTPRYTAMVRACH